MILYSVLSPSLEMVTGPTFLSAYVLLVSDGRFSASRVYPFCHCLNSQRQNRPIIFHYRAVLSLTLLKIKEGGEIQKSGLGAN